ncbi:hypothetical protein [Cellulomonas soli]|uniref:hypothetical protein n=1 Tax=Cellulomonas soli TaxID=931535 RepID=UPI00180B7725|nr:hypothetical protein [Cellulomonas soli]NYI58807.1 hypothetical protein [Cellulomonas soli]
MSADPHAGPDAGTAAGLPHAHVAWVLRTLTALCVATSGAVHLYLWQDGMRNVDIVGPAFLVNGVGGLLLAVLLLMWTAIWPLLGSIGFGLATFGAFVVATSASGLFGVHSRWQGVPEWTSAITEVAAVLLASAAIWRERPGRL